MTLAATGQAGGVNRPSAINFDGTDDRVEVNDNATLDVGTSDFSIVCWLYTNATNAIQRVMNKWETAIPKGWLLNVHEAAVGVNTAGSLRFRMHDGTTSVDVTVAGGIVATTFYQVAVTVDRDSATGLKFWVNTAQAGANKDPTPAQLSLSNAAKLGMGVIPDALGNYLAGRMNGARLFNKALTQVELADLYWNRLKNLSNQLGRWDLDEGTGTIATDLTLTQNGALVGSPAWVDVNG